MALTSLSSHQTTASFMSGPKPSNLQLAQVALAATRGRKGAKAKKNNLQKARWALMNKTLSQMTATEAMANQKYSNAYAAPVEW